jgi:plastocyanin
METTEKRPEQADLSRQAPVLDRRTRGPLDRLVLTAFIGYAFMYFVTFFYVLLVGKVFIPPIVIEAALVLLAAVVVATRWRWAPLPGALVALLTLRDPILQPHNIYTYTHPGQSNYEFMLLVLVTGFGLVALVTSIMAAIRNVRGLSHESGLPRFGGFLLSGFAGLVLGLMMLSLVVTVIPQTAGASTSTGGQPVVHMTASNFASNVVLVPKGSSLLIVSDSSVEHILQNGAWDASGTPHAGAEPGAPTLRNVDITGGSKMIGPFATAGVYHIYCTLHPGMNLTIVVQ